MPPEQNPSQKRPMPALLHSDPGNAAQACAALGASLCSPTSFAVAQDGHDHGSDPATAIDVHLSEFSSDVVSKHSASAGLATLHTVRHPRQRQWRMRTCPEASASDLPPCGAMQASSPISVEAQQRPCPEVRTSGTCVELI